jgi:hypothetical protein
MFQKLYLFLPSGEVLGATYSVEVVFNALVLRIFGECHFAFGFQRRRLLTLFQRFDFSAVAFSRVKFRLLRVLNRCNSFNT